MLSTKLTDVGNGGDQSFNSLAADCTSPSSSSQHSFLFLDGSSPKMENQLQVFLSFVASAAVCKETMAGWAGSLALSRV